MSKILFWIPVSFMIFMPGCSEVEDTSQHQQAVQSVGEIPEWSWSERQYRLGKAVYEESCASCHDEGLDGAPAILDREAWADRSTLWCAVLLEHAKSGYLAMPKKGGNSTLTDQQVAAASEYLMMETFPGRKED